MLAARLAQLDVADRLLERAAPHLLVELGELAGDGDLAQRAARTEQLRERGVHPPGRLVEHDRARLGHECGDALTSLGAAPREEALEHEPVGREAREHQRHEHRARPGHHVDREPGRRRTRARAARRDRRCRACPASVTYATQLARRAPRRRPSRRSPARCARARRAADRRPGQPRWVSSARVRRVSSAAITSASRSASAARVERSPRLPMGVATRSNVRVVVDLALAHASSTRSPARSPQRSNAPASRLDHERGLAHVSATAATAAGSRCAARRLRRRRTRRRSGTACARCARGGTAAAPARRRRRRARAARAGAPRALSATSAAASTSPSRTSQDIQRLRHTLKRISRTSPSTTS